MPIFAVYIDWAGFSILGLFPVTGTQVSVYGKQRVYKGRIGIEQDVT